MHEGEEEGAEVDDDRLLIVDFGEVFSNGVEGGEED
jgi:hypothetical protein